MLRLRAATFMFAAVLMSLSNASAQESEFGMLTCKASASLGLIVGSHQKLRCSFEPKAGGAVEYYTGTVNRLGLDIGIKGGGVMAWAVRAKTTGLSPRALVGKYVGASGDISLGVGAGANVLVGGSHRTISLQPVSVSGNVGVNLAVGIAGLTLR